MIIKKLTMKELDLFINFQYDLYKKDENFRPELRKELINFFTKNPFLKLATITFYLAINNNKSVGRITKIVIPDKPVMFGFFECINDYSVAKKLFDEIDEKRGLIGPMNFTTNDSCGLLIQGYEVPSFLMPYNKKYYKELFEKYGLKKEIDLFAYYISKRTVPSEFRKKYCIIENNLKMKNIIIRNIDLKKYNEELRKGFKIYNDANKNNWGFMPISFEEAEFIAKRLKTIANQEYIFVAEKNGEIIGYFLSIPDINEIKFKKGKLTLSSIIKLLRFKPKKVKVLILGIKDEYRKLGIAGCMINRILEVSHKKKNVEGFEGSYVLENNHEMMRILDKIKGKMYKKYRIYAK